MKCAEFLPSGMSDYKVFTGCYDKSCRLVNELKLDPEWLRGKTLLLLIKPEIRSFLQQERFVPRLLQWNFLLNVQSFSTRHFQNKYTRNITNFEQIPAFTVALRARTFTWSDEDDIIDIRGSAALASSNGTLNVFQSFLTSGIGWTQWWSHPEVVHSDKESNVVSVFTLSVGMHLQITDWWLSFTLSWWNEIDSNTKCHTLRRV